MSSNLDISSYSVFLHMRYLGNFSPTIDSVISNHKFRVAIWSTVISLLSQRGLFFIKHDRGGLNREGA